MLSPLIRESGAKAAAAAAHARELLTNPRIVLFGSGGLGRLVLRGLRTQGLQVEAFSDNNRERWGQTIDGVPVIPPEEAAKRDALVIVSIWNASPRRNHADVTAQLRALGCRNVLSFADAFRQFPDVFLPYFAVDRFENVLQHEAEIASVYSLLADETSREIFRRQLEWRITADFEKLVLPTECAQYFDVYRLRDDEIFVDCGAFDGDTLKQFVSLTNAKFEHYYALEPDAQNREKLEEFVSTLPDEIAARVTTLPLAASDHRGTETFDATGTGSSAFSATGTLTIDCAPLDELVERCTIVKIDVEGAEPKVLHGARELITRQSPVLAVAAYHTQSHMWELPLLVQSMNPHYAFYYREHNAEGFDLILYAIRPERRRLAG